MQLFIYFSITLALLYYLLILAYKYGWHLQNVDYTIPKASNSYFYSIIIPARNEANNIASLLDSIAKNNFPTNQYEIIIVDDFSEDATAAIAQYFLEQNPNVIGKVVNLAKYIKVDEKINAYKKKALDIGISLSKGDIIITTDADCIVSHNWLHCIATAFDNNTTQFVAAPVLLTPYNKQNILYYFQHLDFMTMQGITAAIQKIKAGNMCNGANLAFSKKAFNEVGGYYDINQLASGDDMMLMNKFHKKYKNGIEYLKNTHAIVSTPVQGSVQQFLQQRIRWASKSGKYNDNALSVSLMIVYFFNLNFLIGAIISLWQPQVWWLFLGLLLIKTFIECLFLIPVARFFGKIQSLSIFPLLQPFHILYIIMAGFLGFIGNYEWKGRITK